MEKTVWSVALKGENVFSSLVAAGDWVKKGSYHTAWSVPLLSSCSCSDSYGQGTAIGPRIGGRCWPLLAGLWRSITLLMRLWCAEGDVPPSANLNLYLGWKSRAGRHSDNEPLFGERGDSKLIVSGEFRYPGALQMERQCPVRTVKLTRAVLAIVTFLSWMANVRTSFFTVRITVWNRSGLTLRSVGSGNILLPVPCGQE